MLIDIFDDIGISNPATDHDDLKFEAAWDTNGAICVAHTRVPEKMTLERLAKECPRLRGRTGEAACSLEKAKAGELGAVLLYNRSR